MKNKGFTLIEILGVLVLLAVIASITVPLVNSLINSSKENAKETQEKSFIKAAKNYVADNLYSDCKNSCELSLETLQNEGYLDSGNIKVSGSNKCYDLKNYKITVTYNNKYSYSLPETKEVDCSEDNEK